MSVGSGNIVINSKDIQNYFNCNSIFDLFLNLIIITKSLINFFINLQDLVIIDFMINLVNLI